jgi:GNAT superfamily N-acetyltransferase
MDRDHRALFLVIEERRLQPHLRAQISDLLAGNLDDGVRYRTEGWRTLRPFVRALATDIGGVVVGHAAGFRVPSRPRARVRGLGDVVVHPAHRRRGLARRLCELVVEACWRDGGDVVIAKTTPLRGVLADLGFEPVVDFRFFYEVDGACLRHPDWMAAAAAQLPRPLQLLEGDF